MFVISNTRYPIADVKLRYPDGNFYSLSRGWNNMWAANGGPFSFPVTIQACPLLDQTCRNSLCPQSTLHSVPTCSGLRAASLRHAGTCLPLGSL